MRYFLELAYLGTAYHGWQRQPNALSVQEKIEEVLTRLLQVNVEIVGAGRTDAGVHAKQLFAHFDAEEILNTEEIRFKMNSMLPKDIAIIDIFEVRPDAHARFDALSRSYEYQIIQHKNPFVMDQTFYLKKELNIAKMNEAAEILNTYTNFKCFSKSRTDVKTYNCKIKSAVWKKSGDMLVFHITADRFLRNMVRAIVGTLLEIGQGKSSVDNLHQIIKSEDRGRAGTSVPAQGLFLTEIKYPKIAVA
ncbi:tRNA pseudouridine(38-40) synthase TruA [Autumnicola psychrophila]|uniref:tRNA pseudouridine synthase A n=1 Tax=Autumnicola psychrophila TaxID=3075592 RepID=A0ABU3DM09_9FLAO|nr:tRNA pseudouridine(38-40) synthase TruA [Zunongwangia sp. F225]MDT0684757.1 tRNA pseudouridine(38-40) synthase TruA [Zunongwangia sp. F225]